MQAHLNFWPLDPLLFRLSPVRFFAVIKLHDRAETASLRGYPKTRSDRRLAWTLFLRTLAAANWGACLEQVFMPRFDHVAKRLIRQTQQGCGVSDRAIRLH